MISMVCTIRFSSFSGSSSGMYDRFQTPASANFAHFLLGTFRTWSSLSFSLINLNFFFSFLSLKEDLEEVLPFSEFESKLLSVLSSLIWLVLGLSTAFCVDVIGALSKVKVLCVNTWGTTCFGRVVLESFDNFVTSFILTWELNSFILTTESLILGALVELLLVSFCTWEC